ncbi:carboxy terminal-processing peptidase, partial [Chitinophaga sp.]|uniref:carboxy terminal-processing peptidase n=1 Tax=Chitinophaga sp. TaxID=1869181 RepID=UPI002F956EBF
AVNDKVKELNIVNIKSDMEKFGSDSSKIARNKDWIKIRTKDIYLDEAVNVMNDLIVQSLPKMQRKNQ